MRVSPPIPPLLYLPLRKGPGAGSLGLFSEGIPRGAVPLPFPIFQGSEILRLLGGPTKGLSISRGLLGQKILFGANPSQIKPSHPTPNKDLPWLPGLCHLHLCTLFKEETLNRGLGNSGLVLDRRGSPWVVLHFSGGRVLAMDRRVSL